MLAKPPPRVHPESIFATSIGVETHHMAAHKPLDRT